MGTCPRGVTAPRPGTPGPSALKAGAAAVPAVLLRRGRAAAPRSSPQSPLWPAAARGRPAWRAPWPGALRAGQDQAGAAIWAAGPQAPARERRQEEAEEAAARSAARARPPCCCCCCCLFPPPPPPPAAAPPPFRPPPAPLRRRPRPRPAPTAPPSTAAARGGGAANGRARALPPHSGAPGGAQEALVAPRLRSLTPHVPAWNLFSGPFSRRRSSFSGPKRLTPQPPQRSPPSLSH